MNETTTYQGEKWTKLHQTIIDQKAEIERLNFANTNQANTIQKLDYKLKRLEFILKLIHQRFR